MKFKTFKEYIKYYKYCRHVIRKSKSKKDIENILSRENIEDHFLRLKEVFGCRCDILYAGEYVTEMGNRVAFGHPFASGDVEISISNRETDRVSEIREELGRIKNRIEIEYPVKMTIKDNHPPGWNPLDSVYSQIGISLK